MQTCFSAENGQYDPKENIWHWFVNCLPGIRPGRDWGSLQHQAPSRSLAPSLPKANDPVSALAALDSDACAYSSSFRALVRSWVCGTLGIQSRINWLGLGVGRPRPEPQHWHFLPVWLWASPLLVYSVKGLQSRTLIAEDGGGEASWETSFQSVH